MNFKANPYSHFLRRFAVTVAAIWLLFGCLLYIAKIFGFGFLPSALWIDETSEISTIFGMVFAITALVFAIRSARTNSYGDLKNFFMMIFAPVIGYAAGQNPIAVSIPMILAAFAGHQIDLRFTVSHNDRGGERHCRRPIELQNLPFLFDQICGVSDDVRRQFPAGEPIVVTGHGTSWGIYEQTFRR